MSFWQIFKHLVPRAHAWYIPWGSNIQKFFKGLGEAVIDDPLQETDQMMLGVFPDQTTDLDEYEEQFNILPVAGLTTAERQDRIAAAWKAQGGQDKAYLEGVLHKAGFPFYIHEWWNPSYVPPPSIPPLNAEAGEPLMLAGEPFAEAGNTEIQPYDPGKAYNPIVDIEDALIPHWVLVNKDFTVSIDYYCEAGEPLAEAGEQVAEAGNYSAINFDRVIFPISTDPNDWYFYLYLGTQTWINKVDVPASRQDELEDLILKLFPTHKKIVVCVNYV